MMSNEELTFNVGEEEQPATIAIQEDGTAQQVEKEQPQTTSAELDQYSDKVQKRIDKLTARLRETERREQAAIEYARQVQTRMAQAEQQLVHVDGARIGEAKGRIETQALALKQIIKKAREENDIDTETEAQERLTAILLEQQRVREAEASRPHAEQRLAAQQQAWAQHQQQLALQAQQAQQQAQIDPRAEDWAERNEWFGRDVAMTAAARGIHLQLVTQEGFNPQSDDYYNELDRRIRDNFPQKFQSANMSYRSANRPVQTVAPASRSSGINNSARRTVRLTPSQVAIAKKLNVPLEEYAKYVKE
jgi:hypothetical protein